MRFSQATGAKIIICTIFPAGPASFMDRLRWNSESETAVLEVNNYIRATYPDCLNATKIISQDGKVTRTEVAADLLHLNAKGYAALSVELEKRLA